MSCGNRQQPDVANIQPQQEFITKSIQTQNESNGATDLYEITRETYSSPNIKINYPQIIGLSDKDKQERINKIIKKDALAVVNGYSDRDEVSMNIDYEIKFQNAGLLSIKYSGIRNSKNTPHPTNEFYTSNINIYEGCRLRLKDIVNVDNNFVEKVKKGTFIAVSPEITSKMVNYTNDQLIEAFSTADLINHRENGYGAYSYFTNDSYGISVEVSHVIGDHVEFEVKYRDIADNIKPENEVWKNF